MGVYVYVVGVLLELITGRLALTVSEISCNDSQVKAF